MKNVICSYLLLFSVIAVYSQIKSAAINDVDGNIYQTVTIGNQTWMAENLRTTKYRNGDGISLFTDSIAGNLIKKGAQCAYNNDKISLIKYGRYYNYYAVEDERNIAPEGWHVATRGDWELLDDYLIANEFNYDKKKLGKNYAKSLAATSDWTTSNREGAIGNEQTLNNSSNLNAFPAGYFCNTGFFGLNNWTAWWTIYEFGKKSSLAYLWSDSTSLYLPFNDQKYNGQTVRCVKDSQPAITASEVVTYTSKSALVYGKIIAKGGCKITSRGFCWSTSSQPIYSLKTKTVDPNNPDSSSFFYGILPDLIKNKTYYIRAYATYSYGTKTDVVYENEQVFTFLPLTDIDGNVYHTVKIGNQTWMVENLKTSKYRDGSPINYLANFKQWEQSTQGALCVYNNEIKNIHKYGLLYNWYAVNDSRKIAPLGWHIATDKDWATLIEFLGGEKIAGTKLKANWTSFIKSGKFEGFYPIAVYAGIRNFNGVYSNNDSWGLWWSATENPNLTEALARLIVTNKNDIYKVSSPKSMGYSVRCVKD
jgi:uncharacterized protein (TIGR02145 family)